MGGVLWGLLGEFYKRVQRYYFFLTYANKSRFFCFFFGFSTKGYDFFSTKGTIIRETNRRSTALHGFPESLHNSYTTGISCRAMDERRICGVSYPPSLADAKEETPNERRRGTNVPQRERRGQRGKGRHFIFCPVSV